jgi:predicted SAM-dependent methyltransferase
MSRLPRVDASLFVYNGAAATVAAAIETVLAQSWRNIALTLTDDGSADATSSILQDFADRQLPWPDASVDEILSEHVFEHLSYAEEHLVWHELARVLRPAGIAILEMPDFEWVCASFLAARDEWRDFSAHRGRGPSG